MHKKKGKVYATLTEVKNLIGDVFAAVDEHGSVTITSYNKEKYVISKVQPPQMPEIVDDVLEEKPAAKKEKQAQPEPVAALSQPAVPSLRIAREIAEIEAEQQIVDVFEVFRGVTDDQLFERNSERELVWTTKARANL